MSKTATNKLHDLVFARARGKCECGCQRSLQEAGQMDHFLGRSKAPQSVANCWAIRCDCHEAKTANRPSAAHWLKRFGEHCKRYGYLPELERCRAKYLVLRARGFV